MRVEEKRHISNLGFLTALGNSHHGVIGGFLVLNMTGRPVEFHCTSPVRPNKAQEILYGDTLESFVCGEQIAPALVGRTKNELAAVFTNNPNMLPAAALLGIPLGIVLRRVSESDLGAGELTDSKAVQTETHTFTSSEAMVDLSSISVSKEFNEQYPENDKNGDSLFFYESFDKLPFVPGVDYAQWRETVYGKNRFAFPINPLSESLENASFDECVSRVLPFLKSIDLVEPFERIRLAVEEAQKSN